MKLTLPARALIAFALGAATLAPLTANAAESGITVADESAGRSIAIFEGETLDLSKGWGDARACWVDDLETKCFRSEAALDAALEKAGKLVEKPGRRDLESARAASCSSSLRVYSGTYYNGYLLYLSSRWTWINLSWFAFDNVTSSYKIGACSTTFRSGSYGTGMTYWGNTSAWAQRSTMSGWDNVLSSLYIS